MELKACIGKLPESGFKSNQISCLKAKVMIINIGDVVVDFYATDRCGQQEWH